MKSESGDEVAKVAKKVFQICKDEKKGVSQEMLLKKLSSVGIEMVSLALNQLLKQHKLEVWQDASQRLWYKNIGFNEDAKKFKGLNSDELLVYQIIKSAQNTGIWTKDLKYKSNLQQPQVAKVLKLLEGRKLIKSIKSVANKNRKVYMVYELEPSTDITGGVWYTDNEFDQEFFQILRSAVEKFVLKQKLASLDAIHQYIEAKKITKVALSKQDVKNVLNVLVYDGIVDEKIEFIKDETMYETPVKTEGEEPSGIRIVRRYIPSVSINNISKIPSTEEINIDRPWMQGSVSIWAGVCDQIREDSKIL